MIGLNNKKIGFIVDTSSNIVNGQFDDVKVVPLGVSVQIGNDIKSYKDGVDFHHPDLNVALANKDAIIKTSQASMQDMMKVVTEMCQQYDHVYVFPIHKDLSSNLNSWKILKEDFPNLNIVMTCDIAYSFVWTINKVKEFLKTNESSEENVLKYITENIFKHRLGFMVVENLDQLIKGGRLKGVKAVMAKLFKIKPLIYMDETGLVSYGTCKNHEDLFQKFDEYISKNYPGKKITRALLFVPDEDTANRNQYIAEYQKHYGQIPFEAYPFTTVIVSHTGNKYAAIYVELE